MQNPIETAKIVGAAFASVVSNAVLLAQTPDVGYWTTQISLIAGAIGGAIYVVGMAGTRVYKNFLDVKLAADCERDAALGRQLDRVEARMGRAEIHVAKNASDIREVRETVAAVAPPAAP